MTTIRAIYEKGVFRLLDPVDFEEGTQLELRIVSKESKPIIIEARIVSDDFDKPLFD